MADTQVDSGSDISAKVSRLPGLHPRSRFSVRAEQNEAPDSNLDFFFFFFLNLRRLFALIRTLKCVVNREQN